jgi:hypothetical protein
MAKVAAFIGALFVLVVLLSLIFGNALIGFILAGIVLVVCPLAFARTRGRNRHRHRPDWSGYISFYENDLRDRFPDIRPRRDVGGIGRKGLSSGKCRIDTQGLHWKSGGWATPQTRIAGTFDLPWSRIESGRAYSLTGKIPGLGGGVELVLVDGEGTISGEVLGSVKGLTEALEAGVTTKP